MTTAFEDLMGISYPFARGAWYPIRDLAAFEDHLRETVCSNKEIKRTLRLQRGGWYKVHAEEVRPLLYLTQHMHVVGTSHFKICEANADEDVELRCDGASRRFQVTTAGPFWGRQENHGRDSLLMLEKLETDGYLSGWGPYFKESDGSISNRNEAISREDKDAAHLTGLLRALEGKARHRNPDCELIVYAGGFNSVMIDGEFVELCQRALQAGPKLTFRRVYIVDSGDGAFFEQPSASPTAN